MTQIIVFKKIKSYLIPLFIRTGTLLFFFTIKLRYRIRTRAVFKKLRVLGRRTV